MGEELLRLLLEHAIDSAIVCMDPGLRVTFWSPVARDMFGYEEVEIVGRPYDVLFTPEDRLAGAPADEAITARREGKADDERWHLRKDGSRFYASGVLNWLGEESSVAFIKVARDFTARKRMEDDLRRSRDTLESSVALRTAELTFANEALREAIDARNELLRRLVNAQEGERRRIARDLHDGLGQELTALMLGLGNLKEGLPGGSKTREGVGRLEEIASRIGREAHALVIELRPPSLDDFGLLPALQSYIAGWAERTGVEATFRAVGPDEPLPPDVEATTYRIIQEALNNVARHAAAQHVCVILERNAAGLTALIEDDGRGFELGRIDEDRPRRIQPLGLIGMRDRVTHLGGDLLVESAEGEGTTIRARIPLA